MTIKTNDLCKNAYNQNFSWQLGINVGILNSKYNDYTRISVKCSKKCILFGSNLLVLPNPNDVRIWRFKKFWLFCLGL